MQDNGIDISEGSAFYFEAELPMLEVGFAANPLQGYISGYQSHRRTILVIDDVDENHMVVCDMLEQIGFEQQDAFG